MNHTKTDILVIGAGFAGLSTAYSLAKERPGRVVVIESEKKLGGHASGRNAGMIRQTVSDPVLASLAVEGRRLMGRAQKNGWDIGFRSAGSLLVANGRGLDELKAIRRVTRAQSVECRFLSPQSARRRVLALDRGSFNHALFCPSDALVDIEKLMRGYLNALKALGVPVLRDHAVHSIKKQGGVFRVSAGGHVFLAGKIVNAAGAWAGAVGEKAGAVRVPFRAYRRHLFESFAPEGFKNHWPFVWDLSHNFYFRPLEKTLLLSPCDKDPFRLALGQTRGPAERTDARLEKELALKLRNYWPGLAGLKIKNKKAGLRTMTPDGRFVVGEDPRVKGFYWVAGLGGHGVTTSFSVGKLAGDLILGKKRAKSLVDALSPKRFLNKTGKHAA